MTIDARLMALLKLAAVAYVCICGFMWAYQRNLIYIPLKEIRTPQEYGLEGFSTLALEAADGVRLQAWYRPAQPAYPTVIYFHGNGGNLGNRAQYFHLLAHAGFGVLGIDYRGYGASEGSPSEQGLYQDGRAAVKYAVEKLGIPLRRMIFYGESIGSGVAVQMAAEQPPGLLVLQSAFTSLAAPASMHYPWLPVKWLLKDRFDSISKIGALRSPLLLLHGERDTIVSVAEGRALFAASTQQKHAVYYPDGGHNNLNLELLTGEMLAFARRQGLLAE